MCSGKISIHLLLKLVTNFCTAYSSKENYIIFISYLKKMCPNNDNFSMAANYRRITRGDGISCSFVSVYCRILKYMYFRVNFCFNYNCMFLHWPSEVGRLLVLRIRAKNIIIWSAITLNITIGNILLRFLLLAEILLKRNSY